MALVNTKNKTKQILKEKETRSKPLELCKTKIKKSSLDMINFYVVSTDPDMVNDTDRSTKCRSNFRATPLQRKREKMKVLPKTWIPPINRLNVSH